MGEQPAKQSTPPPEQAAELSAHPAAGHSHATQAASGTGPAWIPAATRDWPTYFDRVAGGEPRQTLIDALQAFDAAWAADATHQPSIHNPPLAIDLGCGEGRDTAELLRRGWAVLAVDSHPDALRRLVSRPDLTHTHRLTMQLRPFESITNLPPATLINASFALPFCPPEHFAALWQVLRGAILPGGRFAGQIFGDRDSWASVPDRSHFTKKQAQDLFQGLQFEHFNEEEKDGSDASGQHKHWHVFHIVARRPE